MESNEISLKLSIALCTFNGESYITPQLKSLFGQSAKPLEIVVQDDGSADATLERVRQETQGADVEVKIAQNHSRLGFAQNFAVAIQRCRGEIIALCDQDDIWRSEKNALVMAAFADAEVGLVFSDAEVVDRELRPLGYSMWEKVRLSSRKQRLMRRGRATAVLLRHYVVTGTTLAFRSRFNPLILPIPDNWSHDAWIALVVSAVAGVQPLPQKLVLYRQHSSNAIGGRRLSLIDEIRVSLKIDRGAYYDVELSKYRALYQRLIEHPEFSPSQSALHDIQQKIKHLENRARLPRERVRRVPGVLREILSKRYFRYARNWGSIALDLLIR